MVRRGHIELDLFGVTFRGIIRGLHGHCIESDLLFECQLDPGSTVLTTIRAPLVPCLIAFSKKVFREFLMGAPTICNSVLALNFDFVIAKSICDEK